MYWGKSNKNESMPEKTFLLNDFFTIKKVLVGDEDKKKYEELSGNINDLKEFWANMTALQKNNKQVNKETLKQDVSNASRSILYLKKQCPDINFTTYLDDEKEIDYFIEAMLSTPDDVDWRLDNIKKFISKAEIELDKVYVSYDVIDRYISSIKESVVSYYEVLNPEKSDFSDEVKFWLAKLNRIGIDEIKYMPVFLALFNNSNDANDANRVEILELMENYIFVKKYTKTINSSTVKQEFYNYPCEFNHNENIEEFSNNIEKIVLKGNKNRDFDGGKFIDKITSLFQDKNGKFGKGFYAWNGLHYLLYEYELSLQEEMNKGEGKVLWEQINEKSIEHILPQTPPNGKWLDVINPLKTEEERNKTIHAIGNLVLVSPSKNSTLGTKPFAEKKEIFSSGSYSEIAIKKYEIWDIESINTRSRDILNFMKSRWKLDIKADQLNKIA